MIFCVVESREEQMDAAEVDSGLGSNSPMVSEGFILVLY